MTTRQPIRRKSWAAWFPIVRTEGLWRKPLGRNTWTTGFGAIPDGATAVSRHDIAAIHNREMEKINRRMEQDIAAEYRIAANMDITANRNRWGMKP